MKIKHLILTILLTAIWGFNFVVTKFGLRSIPPIFFSCIRFFLTSVPAVFFIKPPPIPIKLLALYGIITFGLQFGLLFLGIYLGVTAGIASLLFQIQVFFSILLSAILFKEKIYFKQILGGILAFLGIFLIAINLENKISLIGLILILTSAIAWSIGNIISKQFNNVPFLSLVVWSAMFAWPLLLLLSLIYEKPIQIINCLSNCNLNTIITIVYMSYIATVVGLYIWLFLTKKYPISVVTPFCLLIPIFGIFFSVYFLNEPLEPWKIRSSILVVLGVYINYSCKK